MLCFHSLFILVTFVLLPLCRATASKVLPRARHHEQSPSFVELHNVMVKARKNPAIQPRLHIPAKPIQERAQQQESAAAAVKRALLASRQSCSAGYGYCYGEILFTILCLSVQCQLNINSIRAVLPRLQRQRPML